jgi:glycosyltransferase involved in cell wall biosynthesis
LTSVVIPYIDETDLLGEAIRSVAGQSEAVGEIIVVCNRPDAPDRPPVFPACPWPIRWMHEPRRGSAYARNAGLHVATGEWVQFLDVDDLLGPAKIERQLAHGQGDVIVSPHLFRRTDGREVHSAWQHDDIWYGLLNSALGSTSSWLFRRDAVVRAGGWRPEWSSHQEYELMFRLVVAGCKVSPVGHADTIVRQRRKGSITASTSATRAMDGIRLREQMRDHLVRHDMLTPAREEAFRQYVFRQLRGVYRVDPARADALYERWFSEKVFRPSPPVPAWYRALFGRLGFHRTENLLAHYRRMRGRYFPFLPSNG